MSVTGSRLAHDLDVGPALDRGNDGGERRLAEDEVACRKVPTVVPPPLSVTARDVRRTFFLEVTLLTAIAMGMPFAGPP
jgi:hypothetical protein